MDLFKSPKKNNRHGIYYRTTLKPPVVHCQIKASNTLLDSDFDAHVPPYQDKRNSNPDWILFLLVLEYLTNL